MLGFAVGKFFNGADEECPTPQFAFDAVIRWLPPISPSQLELLLLWMRSRVAGFVDDEAGRRFS